MKLAYVAGPYKGKSRNKIINKIQVIRNILAARKVARALWGMGYAVICPHTNAPLFGEIPDRVFLDGDVVILKRCDLIVMTPRWRSSAGAIDELCIAEAKQIPAYLWDGEGIIRLAPSLYRRIGALVGQDLD